MLPDTPLAERMRPRTIEEYCGQGHLLGEGGALPLLLKSGRVPSCVLYGPPGAGKTTLVRLIAKETGRSLLEINAVTAKVSELRQLVDEALKLKKLAAGVSAIAFVDELYHFNKTQQNVLLPFVERGDIVLIGTTTENPWFEINKTLLSRMIVFELHPLSHEDIMPALKRAALDSERGLGSLGIELEPDALAAIAKSAGGDVRAALTRLEFAVMSAAASGASKLTLEDFERYVSKSAVKYDKAGDEHYRIISALIKSIRGSDPDAAVYWLARLISGGEDVRFICRRLLISAAEDIGLADPNAISVAASAVYAADMTGYPEARIPLAEAVIYLASAPKSNSAYLAVDKALDDIRKGNLQEVPEHLDPHGKGYVYPHDDPRHWTPQKYMDAPERYYFPNTLGYESEIQKRLQKFWRRFS
ncbi:MAG: replication-associated recombination protein A [Synergistaceae bacterium]|nr:replication-associated recombination protein A [Synergistaceae bacterium]